MKYLVNEIVGGGGPFFSTYQLSEFQLNIRMFGLYTGNAVKNPWGKQIIHQTIKQNVTKQ